MSSNSHRQSNDNSNNITGNRKIPKGEGIVDSLCRPRSQNSQTMSSNSVDSNISNSILKKTKIISTLDDDTALSEAFAKMKPSNYRPGERTESTSIRLRRQGFQQIGSSLHNTSNYSGISNSEFDGSRSSSSVLSSKSSANFAMKSIRRESEDWSRMIRPFVADIIFRSIVKYRRYASNAISFRPYTCYAAVLFVDLSNYSKITAEITSQFSSLNTTANSANGATHHSNNNSNSNGAHLLSTIVNEYLSRLLHIVSKYGGDVLKFAGDAILIVWDSPNKEDLRINTIIAAMCVCEMQQKEGVYPIKEVSSSNLCFRIHCGLTVGLIESEIFIAPSTTNNMQKYFHSVSGECLIEISELVDIAKAGEVCISSSCIEYLDHYGTFVDVEGREDCKLLTKVAIDSSDHDDATGNAINQQDIENHIEQCMTDKLLNRSNKIEEDFIHPAVLRLLVIGGLTPTQIAQMRNNLFVLFIAMVSSNFNSSVNWLIEVQTILDKNRCPIIQIIDDDKGVHVIAAINLYQAIPESSVMGLAVCRELIEQEVGCAIGVAQGPTFCGVTGCSTIACRWDITGPPAVRAARLMQYALLHYDEIPVAIDQSVNNDSPMAAAKLVLYDSKVTLKGTSSPVPVYTLSQASTSSAFRILETEYSTNVHQKKVEEIEYNIVNKSRCAVMVTGSPLTGKKVVCQRAAGNANLIPYLHVSDESMGFLQLARTIATWFKYFHFHNEIQYTARNVLMDLERKKWSRAHDECINLINLAIENEIQACFVVDRIQQLDDFSLSLIRECLHGKARRHRSFNGNDSSIHSSTHSGARASLSNNMARGKICFLCVHVPLYNCKTAEQLVSDITRSHTALSIPIHTITTVTTDELSAMSLGVIGIVTSNRSVQIAGLGAGFCAGYFAERQGAYRAISTKLWQDGKHGIFELNNKLEWSVPVGSRRDIVALPVSRLGGEIAMRFSHIFDVLPPLFQTFCKVLSVSFRTRFYLLPKITMWNILNDLIAEGVEIGEYNIVLDEMVEMNLLKVDVENDDEVLSFICPALGDIALDVCTPIQVKSIGNALVERLEEELIHVDFKVPFVIANLHDLLGSPYDVKEQLWIQGYKAFLQASKEWDIKHVLEWKEIFADEIRCLGCKNPEIVMGNDAKLDVCFIMNSASKEMMLLRQYHSPISFGPLGLTLSAITVNVFFQCGEFHGFPVERMAQIYNDLNSACTRYLRDVAALEQFMNHHGFPCSTDLLQSEINIINDMKLQIHCLEDVHRKASIIYDRYIPINVVDRVCRLRSLANKLREMDTSPEIILQHSDKTIRLAYEALTKPKEIQQECDNAQDALMIMATRNWRAKSIPEYLPTYYLQTLARIRNKVLKQLSDTELVFWKHQQSPIDLEAFLLMTALLNKKND